MAVVSQLHKFELQFHIIVVKLTFQNIAVKCLGIYGGKKFLQQNEWSLRARFHIFIKYFTLFYLLGNIRIYCLHRRTPVGSVHYETNIIFYLLYFA